MHLYTRERLEPFMTNIRSWLLARRRRITQINQLQDTIFDQILPLRKPLSAMYINANVDHPYSVEFDGFQYGDPYATSVACTLRVTAIEHHGTITWRETDIYRFYIPYGFARPRVAFERKIFNSDGLPITFNPSMQARPLRQRIIEKLGFHYGGFANSTELTMLVGYLAGLDHSMQVSHPKPQP